jgi:hypothetical protein
LNSRASAANPRYAAGIGASLIAEAAFILLTMPVLAAMGRDIWAVARMPAALVAGPEVMQPPGWVPEDVLPGLAMHIGLAILVGVIYAFLLPRLGVSPVTGGLIAGAVLYLLGFVILPVVFPEWLVPFRVPPVMHVVEIVMHAVYGVVFGLAYRWLTG